MVALEVSGVTMRSSRASHSSMVRSRKANLRVHMPTRDLTEGTTSHCTLSPTRMSSTTCTTAPQLVNVRCSLEHRWGRMPCTKHDRWCCMQRHTYLSRWLLVGAVTYGILLSVMPMQACSSAHVREQLIRQVRVKVMAG